MSKLALNKTSMNQQKRQLATYQRFLPALGDEARAIDAGEKES